LVIHDDEPTKHEQDNIKSFAKVKEMSRQWGFTGAPSYLNSKREKKNCRATGNKHEKKKKKKAGARFVQ